MAEEFIDLNENSPTAASIPGSEPGVRRPWKGADEQISTMEVDVILSAWARRALQWWDEQSPEKQKEYLQWLEESDESPCKRKAS
jgi:hypothetical protein